MESSSATPILALLLKLGHFLTLGEGRLNLFDIFPYELWHLLEKIVETDNHFRSFLSLLKRHIPSIWKLDSDIDLSFSTFGRKVIAITFR